MSTELLRVEHLSKVFALGDSLFAPPILLRALDDISFSVNRGETLGIVGESGCGKSTLGRCLLRLLTPDAGRVLWLGTDLARLSEGEMRRHRRDLQIIFQDPLASLDPRMTVGQIISEPLESLRPDLDAVTRRARVAAMMEAVGLAPDMITRYPHEFSGGQAQRIGIARALISEPKLIVCDEPVSALDVSIQAQILNLLSELKEKFGLTLVFISHNLSVVRHVSDRILVLYLGRVVELASGDALYERPLHPYTRTLLSAVPVPDPRLARARPLDLPRGEIPSPLNPPSGCAFRTRCRHTAARCADERPVLETLADGRQVACHFREALASG